MALHDPKEDARREAAQAAFRRGPPGRPGAVVPTQEVLDAIAEHYRTGKKIDKNLFPKIPVPTGSPEEVQNLPPGESLSRLGRIIGGKFVGPGGAGGVLAAPSIALGALAGAKRKAGQPDVRPPTPITDAVTGAIVGASESAQNAIQGDVIPGSTGEVFAGKASEELSAALPVAKAARVIAKARVASGKAGRIALGIDRESKLQFFGGEIVGAGGAGVGRTLVDTGDFKEGLAAFGGDFGTRGLPVAWRGVRMIFQRYAGVSIDSIPRHERRILEEILEVVREPGGLEKLLADPNKQDIVNEAALALQRIFDDGEGGEKALRHMAAYFDDLDALNVPRTSLSIGELTGNPAAATAERDAIRQNPRWALQIVMTREGGSAAVRKRLIEMGVGATVDNIDAVRTAIRQDTAQRLADLRRAPASAEGQGAAELGGFADAKGARSAQDTLSEPVGASIEAARQAQRELIVEPLYDSLQEYLSKFPEIRFGVGHSKAKLAELLAPVAAPQRRQFGAEANAVLGDINDWPATGVSFKELRSMQVTLNVAADTAIKDGNQPLQRLLGKLHEAVTEDILTFRLIDDTPTPRPLLSAGRPGPDNAAGIVADASDDIPFDPDAALGPQLEARRAGKGPGRKFPTPEGELDPQGLASNTIRREIGRRLTLANAGYMEWAASWKDPTVVGMLADRAVRKNPVAHADVLRKYFSPTPKDGYAKRIREFIERAGDIDAVRKAEEAAFEEAGRPRTVSSGGVETLRHAEDWLIADAYAATVTKKVLEDGTEELVFNRSAMDRWRKANWAALEAFEDVDRKLKAGSDWFNEARALGATPAALEATEQIMALRHFVDDPEAFWNGLRSGGSVPSIKQVDDLFGAVLASGDDLAMEGLKASFWQSQIVQAFSKNIAVSEGELAVSALNRVLNSPQLVHAVEKLWNPEQVRLLKVASRVAKGIETTAKIPTGVAPVKLEGAVEQITGLLKSASIFTVILGPRRRALRMSTALQTFRAQLDNFMREALLAEAFENPDLLAQILKLNPSVKDLDRIIVHMSANVPTLWARVPLSSEQDEKRGEVIQRRIEEAGARARDTLPDVNRATVEPPRTSFTSPPLAGLGRFG